MSCIVWFVLLWCIVLCRCFVGVVLCCVVVVLCCACVVLNGLVLCWIVWC